MNLFKVKNKTLKYAILKKELKRFSPVIFAIIAVISIAIGMSYSRAQKKQAAKDQVAAAKLAEKEFNEELAKRNAAASNNEIMPWYSYRAIAHALGGLDGKKYLNSVDCFYYNYSLGYRLFEMDIRTTADHKLVGKHHWAKKLSDPIANNGEPVVKKEFMKTKILGKYTPTSLEDMLKLMGTYKDFYLITDTKATYVPGIKSDFKGIVKAAKAIGHPEYLDRVIVQVYSATMYNTIKKIYPFKHYIYTTYKQRDAAFYRAVKFCKDNGIEGFTCPSYDVNDYRMDILKKEGLYAYTNTVNSTYHTKQFMRLGVYGIYSDWLSPVQIDFSYYRSIYPEWILKIVKAKFPIYENV